MSQLKLRVLHSISFYDRRQLKLIGKTNVVDVVGSEPSSSRVLFGFRRFAHLPGEFRFYTSGDLESFGFIPMSFGFWRRWVSVLYPWVSVSGVDKFRIYTHEFRFLASMSFGFIPDPGLFSVAIPPFASDIWKDLFGATKGQRLHPPLGQPPRAPDLLN